MTYHIDPDCELALIRLNDALCSFNLVSGREYTLVLVPGNTEEKIHISIDGKPDDKIRPEKMLELVMRERGDLKQIIVKNRKEV
jgi:hypothetical protein